MQSCAPRIGADCEITTELAQARRHAGDSHPLPWGNAEFVRGNAFHAFAIIADHQVYLTCDRSQGDRDV